MDKIAILFPSADNEALRVRKDYESEYLACRKIDMFLPVLYNEDSFVEGSPIRTSIPAPYKKMYFIRRGRRLPEKENERMLHSLKRRGFTNSYDFPKRHFGKPETMTHETKINEFDFMPIGIWAYHSCWNNELNTHACSPDLEMIQTVLPAVVKDDSGTLRDDCGNVVVIDELASRSDVDRAVAALCKTSPEKLDDSVYVRNVRLERYIEIAKAGNVPIEWRAYLTGYRLVYLAPMQKAPEAVSLSKPPQWLLEAASFSNWFCAVDVALDVTGRWWILKRQDVESAAVPRGGSAEDFYNRLAREIEYDNELPEWCWWIAADIIAEHVIGEDKVTVPGTRHFAPGTTVFYANAYWGQGGERCTVIGVPKYSDDPVGVTIQSKFLTNFRAEKITDRTILNALIRNRLREPSDGNEETILYGDWLDHCMDREFIERQSQAFNETHPQDTANLGDI